MMRTIKAVSASLVLSAFASTGWAAPSNHLISSEESQLPNFCNITLQKLPPAIANRIQNPTADQVQQNTMTMVNVASRCLVNLYNARGSTLRVQRSFERLQAVVASHDAAMADRRSKREAIGSFLATWYVNGAVAGNRVATCLRYDREVTEAPFAECQNMQDTSDFYDNVSRHPKAASTVKAVRNFLEGNPERFGKTKFTECSAWNKWGTFPNCTACDNWDYENDNGNIINRSLSAMRLGVKKSNMLCQVFDVSTAIPSHGDDGPRYVSESQFQQYRSEYSKGIQFPGLRPYLRIPRIEGDISQLQTWQLNFDKLMLAYLEAAKTEEIWRQQRETQKLNKQYMANTMNGYINDYVNEVNASGNDQVDNQQMEMINAYAPKPQENAEGDIFSSYRNGAEDNLREYSVWLNQMNQYYSERFETPLDLNGDSGLALQTQIVDQLENLVAQLNGKVAEHEASFYNTVVDLTQYIRRLPNPTDGDILDTDALEAAIKKAEQAAESSN